METFMTIQNLTNSNIAHTSFQPIDRLEIHRNNIVNQSNQRERPQLGTTIELSADGLRHLEISKALSGAMNDIVSSGEGTGSRVQDLSIAFGRVYHLFNPTSEGGASPNSDAGRFVAGEVFTKGEIIFYDNRHWEILQDFTHNGDNNWRPGLAHSLFREHSAPPAQPRYCPILHNAFSGMMRMAFGVEATSEMSSITSRFDSEICENTGAILRATVNQFPVEVQEAWKQSQRDANVFTKEFLRNVYTEGHENAFNIAISLVTNTQ